jgi:hypothetical protein
MDSTEMPDRRPDRPAPVATDLAQTGAPTTRTPRRVNLTVIRFGEFLVERGVIDREQLLKVLMEHHLRGGRIGDMIVRLGLCPANRLEDLANEYHSLTAVEL